jgi:hypothetical protein
MMVLFWKQVHLQKEGKAGEEMMVSLLLREERKKEGGVCWG